MSEDAIAQAAPAVKRMKLRYAGTCCRCGTPLAAGVTADHDRTSRTVACVECPPSQSVFDPDATSAPTHAIARDLAPQRASRAGFDKLNQPVGNQPVGNQPFDNQPVNDQPFDKQPLAVVDGTAGGSAAREFDRRHEARQQRVQANHPRIGKLLLAVFDDPQSTKAWSTGAVGEQRLGELLIGVAGPDVRVLHDRRIPRTTANIDHLVVCPSGVFVVDAKRYRDARPELRVEGGLLRPRQEFLCVGGRDRTRLVESMHRQLDLVRAALADQPDVPVRGVLCFVDADWPLIGGSFTVEGVSVMWPRKLKARLAETGPLDIGRIADLQWQLHEAFPRQREV